MKKLIVNIWKIFFFMCVLNSNKNVKVSQNSFQNIGDWSENIEQTFS